jgi:hypothetical protein
MPKIALAPLPPSPAPAPITEAHRASAAEHGFSLDGVVGALRLSLNEAKHSLSAIIGSAPDDDGNKAALQSLHRRLLIFAGELTCLTGRHRAAHDEIAGAVVRPAPGVLEALGR